MRWSIGKMMNLTESHKSADKKKEFHMLDPWLFHVCCVKPTVMVLFSSFKSPLREHLFISRGDISTAIFAYKLRPSRFTKPRIHYVTSPLINPTVNQVMRVNLALYQWIGLRQNLHRKPERQTWPSNIGASSKKCSLEPIQGIGLGE